MRVYNYFAHNSFFIVQDEDVIIDVCRAILLEFFSMHMNEDGRTGIIITFIKKYL